RVGDEVVLHLPRGVDVDLHLVEVVFALPCSVAHDAPYAVILGKIDDLARDLGLRVVEEMGFHRAGGGGPEGEGRDTGGERDAESSAIGVDIVEHAGDLY